VTVAPPEELLKLHLCEAAIIKRWNRKVLKVSRKSGSWVEGLACAEPNVVDRIRVQHEESVEHLRLKRLRGARKRPT
jgi:hypothetical protein